MAPDLILEGWLGWWAGKSMQNSTRRKSRHSTRGAFLLTIIVSKDKKKENICLGLWHTASTFSFTNQPQNNRWRPNTQFLGGGHKLNLNFFTQEITRFLSTNLASSHRLKALNWFHGLRHSRNSSAKQFSSGKTWFVAVSSWQKVEKKHQLFKCNLW